MGDCEAKGAGKVLNHAEVPKYKTWIPKGCQIQVSQKQVPKSAKNMVTERKSSTEEGAIDRMRDGGNSWVISYNI